MKIISAKSAGFCYGVKRAVKLTEEALKTKPKPIQMIGNLVHNEFVVWDLKNKGLKILTDFKKLESGSFVIKSHSLPRQLNEKIAKKNVMIVDATCPNVKKSIEKAKSLENNGCRVVIFGDEHHDEIKAISGNLKNKPLVIKSHKEINKIKSGEKIGLLSQTTQSYDEFLKIVGELTKKVKDLKYYNTICPATRIRQNEAKKLAKKVDLMLVIGSTTSANTSRLYQICKNINRLTYLVESDNFIKKHWFKNCEKVGLTAGASTPIFLIKRSIKKINNFFQSSF